MTIFTQKSSKMKAFQSILGFFGLFLAIFLISSCSKSSISEIDQMKSFATKNNIEYITDPSGLMYQIINPGTGTKPRITSTVSANTTSGFSIVSYTGTGANATVGHGLGVAPKFIIFKNAL